MRAVAFKGCCAGTIKVRFRLRGFGRSGRGPTSWAARRVFVASSGFSSVSGSFRPAARWADGPGRRRGCSRGFRSRPTRTVLSESSFVEEELRSPLRHRWPTDTERGRDATVRPPRLRQEQGLWRESQRDTARLTEWPLSDPTRPSAGATRRSAPAAARPASHCVVLRAIAEYERSRSSCSRAQRSPWAVAQPYLMRASTRSWGNAAGVLVHPSDAGRRVRMCLFGRTSSCPKRRPVACIEPNRSCPKRMSLLGGRTELPEGFAAAFGHAAAIQGGRRRQDRWREHLVPRQQAVAL